MKDPATVPVVAFEIGEVRVGSAWVRSETVLGQHRIHHLANRGFVCIGGVTDDQDAFSTARFPVTESISLRLGTSLYFLLMRQDRPACRSCSYSVSESFPVAR